MAIRIVADRGIGFADCFADGFVIRQRAGIEVAIGVEGSASFYFAAAVLVQGEGIGALFYFSIRVQ